jgi:hypothetical protein
MGFWSRPLGNREKSVARSPSIATHQRLVRASISGVVAKSSGYSRKLTLRQYLKATHVGVGVLTGQPTIPDQRLAALGEKRRCALEVPFLAAAIRCVPRTDLIATVPRRLAKLEAHDATSGSCSLHARSTRSNI